MKKKIECHKLVDGKPTCGISEEDCPVLHSEKFIDMKPGTLVIYSESKVGIVSKKKSPFPEEVYVKATAFTQTEGPDGLIFQKEELTPLLELPEAISETLTPEEILSMFLSKIVIEQAKKLQRLSNRVNELSEPFRSQS